MNLKRYYNFFRIYRRLVEKNMGLFFFLKRHNLKNIKALNIEKYKKSDTIFILGSGDSINEITENQWSEIKQQDTVGLNNWILHEFVPTFFFFESTAKSDLAQIEMNETIFKNLKARLKAYTDTPFIVHYLKRYFFDHRILKPLIDLGLIYMQAPVSLPIKNKKDITEMYDISIKMGFFNRINQSVYKRGSIAKIIHFCVAAGYKKIILLGVDLNQSPYFFNNENFKLPLGCQAPDYTKKNTNTVHLTINKEKHPVTMIDIIEVLHKEIGRLDVELFNGSSSSSLQTNKILPYYWK